MRLDGVAVDLVLGDTFLPASHGGEDLEDGWVEVPSTVGHDADDDFLPRVLLRPDGVFVRLVFGLWCAHLLDILNQRMQCQTERLWRFLSHH